jgi:YVTN family beta-propeller protein
MVSLKGYERKANYFGWLVGLVLLLAFSQLPAEATRIPRDVKEKIIEDFPDAKMRLDGSIETKAGVIFVPLIPASEWKKRSKNATPLVLPSSKNPEFLLYPQGWCFLKITKVGKFLTITLPQQLPGELRKQILMSKLPSDFMVPEHFILPKSLKACAGDAVVAVDDDARLVPEPGAASIPQPKTAKKKPVSTSGVIFVTSLGSGTISLLDEKNLNKEMDFPTEGTPGPMVAVDGKLYIADATKNRILILDPEHRNFIGQIELPANSHPRGLATLPNGRLIYVSEGGASAVAIIETAVQKVLMRTKVPPGPGNMAVTPDGNRLIVLNVPSGKITILSTLNQAVQGTLQVGTMPSSVIVSHDSKYAYIACRVSNYVAVVDIATRKLEAKITTGNGPTGLALSEDGTKLYVANARENSISCFDRLTRQRLKDVKLPMEIEFPGALMLMPDGKHMFVTSAASDSVGLLNLDTFEFDTLSNVGHSSHQVVWVPKPAK